MTRRTASLWTLGPSTSTGTAWSASETVHGNRNLSAIATGTVPRTGSFTYDQANRPTSSTATKVGQSRSYTESPPTRQSRCGPGLGEGGVACYAAAGGRSCSFFRW